MMTVLAGSSRRGKSLAWRGLSMAISFQDYRKDLQEKAQLIAIQKYDEDTVEVYELLGRQGWYKMVMLRLNKEQVYTIDKASNPEKYRNAHHSFFLESDGCICHKCKKFKPDGRSPFDRCSLPLSFPCDPDHKIGIVAACLYFELETGEPTVNGEVKTP
jgi:hypothetical protein